MENLDKITDRLLFDLPAAINAGIQKLAPVGEKAWDLIMMGIRYDGIMGVITNLIYILLIIGGVIVLTKAGKFIYKKVNVDNYKEKWDDIAWMPFALIALLFSIFSGILFFQSFTAIQVNLKKAIMPEVYVIQTAAENAIDKLKY